MKEYLIEEIPESDAMQVELAIKRWRNEGSKFYPNTKRLRIPIIDYRLIYDESNRWMIWYVYDLEENKLYLE